MSRARDFADLAGSADAGGLTGRNLVINGAQTLHQRGGDVTASGSYVTDRFAMSFGILGSFDLFGNGQPWLKINDPGCCSKTFPLFFDRLNTARNDSHGKK